MGMIRSGYGSSSSASASPAASGRAQAGLPRYFRPWIRTVAGNSYVKAATTRSKCGGLPRQRPQRSPVGFGIAQTGQFASGRWGRLTRHPSHWPWSRPRPPHSRQAGDISHWAIGRQSSKILSIEFDTNQCFPDHPLIPLHLAARTSCLTKFKPPSPAKLPSNLWRGRLCGSKRCCRPRSAT